jgi:hypothetical protein
MKPLNHEITKAGLLECSAESLKATLNLGIEENEPALGIVLDSGPDELSSSESSSPGS